MTVSLKRKRESNIELCRIICMLLIIMHHCVGHGGAIGMPACANSTIALFVFPGGKLCFDAFVAISTWFMADQKFRTERFLKTWTEVLVYSVGIYFVSVLILGNFSVRSFVSSLLPMTGNSHGFAAAYLVFYLFLPFLRMISDRISRNQAKWIAILLLFVQVFSQIIGVIVDYTQPLNSELTLFVTCYFISFYLKNYPNQMIHNRGFLLTVVIGCWLVIFGSWIYALRGGASDFAIRLLLMLINNESSIFPLIGGYAFFLLFLTFKLPYSRVINTIAHTTFGILLIHDHNFLRSYFWNSIFKAPEWYFSPYFVGILLAITLTVFVVCGLIDFIRQNTVEKWMFNSRFIKRFCEKCDSWLLGGQVQKSGLELPQKSEEQFAPPKTVIQTERRVTGMDVLRVVIVLAVFLLHSFIFSSQHGFQFSDRTWFLKTPSWAAVWVFFFISGVNIGAGFYTGRYKENGRYTVKSVLTFYAQRVMKIAVPTWIFSIIALCIVEPELLWNSPEILVRIFTFTYGNNPASNAIGATWYVSSLIWLYFIAPFFMAFFEFVVTKFKKSGGIILWAAFLILGFALRWYLYKAGVDWSSKVYVPFYCNIDIFACGMLCNFVPRKEAFQRVGMKVIAAVVMTATLVFNTRIYYLSDWNPTWIILYCYVMPSVYIVATTLYALAFNGERSTGEVSAKEILNKPQLLISAFAGISFEFYLVHSMILYKIHPYIEASSPLRTHLMIIFTAFLISTFFAYIMHTAFHKCLRFRSKR